LAGPPGEPGGWNEIGTSLERLHQDEEIFYTGLTGPLLLRACGDRRVGASSTWQIHDGRIETVANE